MGLEGHKSQVGDARIEGLACWADKLGPVLRVFRRRLTG